MINYNLLIKSVEILNDKSRVRSLISPSYKKLRQIRTPAYPKVYSAVPQIVRWFHG